MEVTGPKAGIQQVLAGEARIEVQAKVVIEAEGTPVTVVITGISGCVGGAVVGRGGTCTIRSAGTILAAAKRHRTDNEGGLTLQFGGGGELGSFQLADLLLDAVDAAADHGQLLLEFLSQTLEFIGGLGDAIEAGIKQGGRLKTGERLGALEGAIGIAGHAAVLLDQIVQGLVGPVGGLHITELGDVSDLIAGDRGIAIEIGLGGQHRHGSHKAERSGADQQLLEGFHRILTPKKRTSMFGSLIRITKDADLPLPPSHRPWCRRTHPHELNNKEPGCNAAGIREEGCEWSETDRKVCHLQSESRGDGSGANLKARIRT